MLQLQITSPVLIENAFEESGVSELVWRDIRINHGVKVAYQRKPLHVVPKNKIMARDFASLQTYMCGFQKRDHTECGYGETRQFVADVSEVDCASRGRKRCWAYRAGAGGQSRSQGSGKEARPNLV